MNGIKDFLAVSAQLFHLQDNAQVDYVIKCIDESGAVGWEEASSAPSNAIAEWSTLLVSPPNGPNFDLAPNGLNLFGTIDSALVRAAEIAGSLPTTKRVLILLRPGVYAGNITVPYYVNLKGVGEECVIQGTVTVNSATPTAENVKIEGVKITTGGVVLANSSATNLHLKNCTLDGCSVQVNSTSVGADYYTDAQIGSLFMESCAITAPAANEAITIASDALVDPSAFSFVYLLNCKVQGFMNFTASSGGYQVILMNNCEWNGLSTTTNLAGSNGTLSILLANDSDITSVVVSTADTVASQVGFANCTFTETFSASQVNVFHESCTMQGASVSFTDTNLLLTNSDVSGAISLAQTSGSVMIDNCTLKFASLMCSTDCALEISNSAITCFAALSIGANAQRVAFGQCHFVNDSTDFIAFPDAGAVEASFSHCTFTNKRAGGVLVKAFDVQAAPSTLQIRAEYTTFNNCNVSVNSGSSLVFDSCLISSDLTNTLFDIGGTSCLLANTRVEGSVNTQSSCATLEMRGSTFNVGATNFFDLIEGTAAFIAQNCTFDGQSFGASETAVVAPNQIDARISNCTIKCATNLSFTVQEILILNVADSDITCTGNFILYANDLTVDLYMYNSSLAANQVQIDGSAALSFANYVNIVMKSCSVNVQTVSGTTTEGTYSLDMYNCDIVVGAGAAFTSVNSTDSQTFKFSNTRVSGGCDMTFNTDQPLTVEMDQFNCEADLSITSDSIAEPCTLTVRNSSFNGAFTGTSSGGFDAQLVNSAFDCSSFSLTTVGATAFDPLQVEGCTINSQGTFVIQTAVTAVAGSILLKNNRIKAESIVQYPAFIDARAANLQMSGNSVQNSFSIHNDTSTVLTNNSFTRRDKSTALKLRYAVVTNPPPGSLKLFNNFISGQIVIDDTLFSFTVGQVYDIMLAKNTVLAGELDGGETYAQLLEKMWIVFQSAKGPGFANRQPQISSYHNKVISVPLVDNGGPPVPLITLLTTNFTTVDSSEVPMNLRINTSAVNEAFSFTLVNEGVTNCTIDWGDDPPAITVVPSYTASVSHTYSTPGDYNIKIFGSCSVRFTSKTNIQELVWWNIGGNVRIGTQCFRGCTNMVATNVVGLPKFTTNLSECFRQCNSLTTINNINRWDVSMVTNMNTMFAFSPQFNDNIGGWDVSSVQTFVQMFLSSTSFNNGGSASIGGWITSSATNIQQMFDNTSFNQPIENWDVSNVTNFKAVVALTPFDQSLGNWNIQSANSATNPFQNLLFGVNLSTASYDATLFGWANLATVPSNIIISFNGSKYTDAVSRTFLSDDKGWSITDGGLAP